MNQIFLVTGTYAVTHYMSDTRHQEFKHLVMAESPEKAYEVVEKFYESKTSEYSVYYRVDDIHVHETLKQAEILG